MKRIRQSWPTKQLPDQRTVLIRFTPSDRILAVRPDRGMWGSQLDREQCGNGNLLRQHTSSRLHLPSVETKLLELICRILPVNI